MPGSLPGVQRQHQPPLWKLRSLCLLRHVGGVLQWNMHRGEFRSEQLRRLWKRLSSIGAVLQSGRLYRECVRLGSNILRRCLRQHKL